MKSSGLLVSCVLLLATGGVPAEAADNDQPSFTAAGAFFALSVDDIDASSRWYAKTFGLRVTMQQPKANGAAVTVLEGHGLIVELIQHDAAQSLTRSPETVHGIFKAGIIVPDFEKWLAMLKAGNVDIAFGPFPARPGQRANVIVRDNAGNLIQIFGPKR